MSRQGRSAIYNVQHACGLCCALVDVIQLEPFKMLQPRSLPTKMTAYMSAIHAEHHSGMFHSILSIGGSGGGGEGHVIVILTV
jgi:hypothetical protein